MPNPVNVTVLASAAITASGASAGVDLDGLTTADTLHRRLARLMLRVSAVSGADSTIDVTVQTSPDNTTWADVIAFDTVDVVSFTRLHCAPLERYIRVKYTVAGSSPSLTVEVTGEAHVIYAGPTDFYALGLPRRATDSDDIDPKDALAMTGLAASSLANAKIPREYKLPLKQPYPESLTAKVCEIWAWKFLQVRGIDPDDGANKVVEKAHDMAVEWLDALGKGVTPDWIDATPDEVEAAAAVVSGTRRGW